MPVPGVSTLTGEWGVCLHTCVALCTLMHAFQKQHDVSSIRPATTWYVHETLHSLTCVCRATKRRKMDDSKAVLNFNTGTCTRVWLVL